MQLPILSNTMDEVSTLAMWEDDNIGTSQQRIIMKHLRHYFGTRIIVPEVKVSVLSKLKVLDPITGSYTKTDTNEKNIGIVMLMNQYVTYYRQDTIQDKN